MAGLRSGPIRLKMVRMPSCCRTGPTCLKAGWKCGAKEDEIALGQLVPGRLGVGDQGIAQVLDHVDVPHLLETARLPCLTTL